MLLPRSFEPLTSIRRHCLSLRPPNPRVEDVRYLGARKGV